MLSVDILKPVLKLVGVACSRVFVLAHHHPEKDSGAAYIAATLSTDKEWLMYYPFWVQTM